MVTRSQPVSSLDDVIDYMTEQTTTDLSESQAAEAIKLLFEFAYEECFAGRVVEFLDVGRFQSTLRNPTALEWIDSANAGRTALPKLQLIG